MEALDLKQVQIVGILGVSKGTVSKWLSDSAIPSKHYGYQLAKLLRVSSDWLLEGERAPISEADDVSAEGLEVSSSEVYQEWEDEYLKTTPSKVVSEPITETNHHSYNRKRQSHHHHYHSGDYHHSSHQDHQDNRARDSGLKEELNLQAVVRADLPMSTHQKQVGRLRY